MKKSFLKKITSSILLASSLLTIGCGGESHLNAPFYDPNQSGQYDPVNDPSNLARSAVDGVRPKVEIKNMFFRVHKEVAAKVYDLFGELVSRVPTDPVNFDDVSSFQVQVHQSKLGLDGKNMDNLMKYFTLNYPDAPLKDLKHTITNGRLSIKGKMKQAGIFVNFEESGPVHATPDGLIEFAPDSIKTAGVPAKGLLDFFGIETAKLLSLNEQRGLKLVGNSIIMYPDRLFPPPIMKGRVARVEAIENELIIYFDDGTKLERPPLAVPEGTFKNYQHVYGGAVRMVGNEIHEDANLMMVDMNESNFFDFYLAEYIKHTMAGQVNILGKSGALVNFMPDYDDIPKRLGRKPVFDKIDSGLGENLPVNPNSNPKEAKQKAWAHQPKPRPVNSNNPNNY